MTHRTPSQIGLVRLSDSDFVLANPEDDLRGKDVYVVDGKVLGSVEDLYIDPQEHEVRFLEVGTGGVLGIGEKRFLIPVEAITQVAAGRVTIEPDRTEKVAGPAPFNTKEAPPSADDRSDAYAALPFGNAESTADHRGDVHSSFPFGRRPY